MARIALRAYQREIEQLIETHQYDQAIAHCKHILKFYPKEVHAYRLLGKAYLESQRYGDASDIFMRVLSSVPDDFVSHVGMSIIREDEGNLDDAIWHMERAFESQPANSAIQGELRRLHGRREGIEPPKIRLTRGALARMYIKGELYSQAIAELRAGLHEHPKRFDLQVALANAYYISGQRVDAVDICSSLIKALPYCLEANRILSEILSGSERAEEAQVYAKRVYSLDPYSAHTTPSTPTADLVSEAAVTIEKLEWRPGSPISQTPDQPEWAASLGVTLGASQVGKESVPDWLSEPVKNESDRSPKAVKPFAESETSESSPEAIPEWMQEAGWGPSTGEMEQDSSFRLEDDSQHEAAELTPAEIPDWLQPMAPDTPIEGANVLTENETTDGLPVDETPSASHPWLEETPPGPTDSVVTWLERSDAPIVQESQLDPEPADPLDMPDWLHDFESAATIKSLDELDSIPAQQEEIAEDIHSSELDDVVQIENLAGMESVISHQDAPTTIDELLEAVPSADRDEVLARDESESGDISDWLQGFDAPGSEETPVKTESTENIPTWLVGLGEDIRSESHEEESAIEIPLISAEEIPVESLNSELVQTGEQEVKDITSDSIQVGEGEPLEDDAAFAWLESLAVKQGAEEALLLNPEDRRDEPPAWVQSESPITETSEEFEKPEDIPVVQRFEPDEELEDPVVVPISLEAATSDQISQVETEPEDTPPAFEDIFESVQSDIVTSEKFGEEIPETEDILPEPEFKVEVEQEMPDVASIVREEATAQEINPEVIEREGVESVLDADKAISKEIAELAEDTQEKILRTKIPAAGVSLAAAMHSLPDHEPDPDSSRSAMLFAPVESGELDIKPPSSLESIPIDEGEIIKGDTQPTTIRPSTGDRLALEGSDLETTEMTGSTESDFQTPETIDESVDDEVLPEWVFESEVQISPLEEPTQEQVEVEPAESTLDEPQELDDEEAFSWLEALAAKQQPDDIISEMGEAPQDEPPSWIAQALIKTEDERPDTEEGPLPEWLLENAPEHTDIAEGQPVEEEIPEWLKITPPMDEDVSKGDTPVGAPELPPWLVGIEEEKIADNDTEWVPSEETFEEPLPESEFLAEEMASEEAVALESEPQSPPIDINQVGLNELERLPGIGFVKAQAIMDYRDEQGPFRSTDELMNVSGIGPELLDNLRENILIAPADTAISGREEPAENNQIALLQARNALVQGNIALALERYKSLILSKEVLPEVISDLNEALYRFPVDVAIWETLGDAHVRCGSLQEALNAYSKAEDYLN